MSRPRLGAKTRIGVVALLILAGCSTGPRYVPLSDHGRFGYAVEDVAEAHIRVSYVAPRRTVTGYRNPATSPAARKSLREAFDLALLRASEVAVVRGWPELSVIERQNDVDAQISPYRGDDFSSGFFENRLGGAGRWVLNRQPEATLRTTVVIDVTLHTGTGDDRGRVVASEMADELRLLYGL